MEGSGHSYNSLFKGFLLGGLLGATAGILFTPKAGKELRSGIKDRGEKMLRDTKESYSDVKAKAETMYENARYRIFAGCGEKMKEKSFRDMESPEEVVGEA